jgi:hypothetical protein
MTGARWAQIIGLVMAGCVAASAAAPADPARHTIALTMYVRLDHVAANPDGPGHGRVGDIDRIRLTYDVGAVNPVSKRVPLSSFQHVPPGQRLPQPPDAAPVPVDDSWLDLSQAPFRLHLKASVVHGEAIVIEVDETSRRLTIHRPGEVAAAVISGPYWIDSTPERSTPRRRGR